MRGGVGDDLLLKGGAGNDLIFGDEGKDIIQGGAGNDIVFGDGGEVPPDFNLADRHGFVRGLYALTDGDDTISGEGGDDVLIGSGGIDTITGGTATT
jgi:Ca2+-binding RTX toxin-like protein